MGISDKTGKDLSPIPDESDICTLFTPRRYPDKDLFIINLFAVFVNTKKNISSAMTTTLPDINTRPILKVENLDEG